MININDDRKERKISKTKEKSAMKKDYGYSIYEALEYGRNNQNQTGLGLHTELIRSFIR
jgi:hypothetical protein